MHISQKKVKGHPSAKRSFTFPNKTQSMEALITCHLYKDRAVSATCAPQAAQFGLVRTDNIIGSLGKKGLRLNRHENNSC